MRRGEVRWYRFAQPDKARSRFNTRFDHRVSGRGDGGSGDLNDSRHPFRSPVVSSRWHARRLCHEPGPRANGLEGESGSAYYHVICRQNGPNSPGALVRLRFWRLDASPYPSPGGRGNRGCSCYRIARVAILSLRRSWARSVVPPAVLVKNTANVPGGWHRVRSGSGRAKLWRQRDEAVAVGVHHQPKAVGHLQFGEDPRQIVAHRRLTDVQARGDVPVLEAFANEGDDVALTCREGGNLGGLGVARWSHAGRLYLVKNGRHHRGFEPDLPSLDLPDGLQEDPGRGLLAKQPHGAAAHGLTMQGGVADPGQDQHPCPRGRGA